MNNSSCIVIALFLFNVSVTFSQTKVSTDIVITKADLIKAGTNIPKSSIGKPVGSVKLYEPRWIEDTDEIPAYGVVEGSIFPVDPNGWPINLRVLLPVSWSQRAMQAGGCCMNEVITERKGKNPMLNKGFAIHGRDSGHQTEIMDFIYHCHIN
jgi:hypothetical protein